MPEFGVPAPAAPREEREATALTTRAAPAMATVARVTEVWLVDFPFWMALVRQEIMVPLEDFNLRVAKASRLGTE